MRDFVPYPPVGRYRGIGDRRTAALVAVDGRVDRLCLPDCDDDPEADLHADARASGPGSFVRARHAME